MIIEEKGNLFDVSNEYSLAHCVGRDYVMGAGIAIEFKKKFGNTDVLLKNCRGIGTCNILTENQTNCRNIFYLVTKKWSKYSKPTYQDIELSIIDMFKIATDKKIKKIAMPKIGCGLDKLEWKNVVKILEKHIPKDTEILVRYL